jgi:hypothetical protein
MANKKISMYLILIENRNLNANAWFYDENLVI